MLTRGDDYPVHQTSEPIAHIATSDRNFYDRYFFNGYTSDGELFFAIALGVYPNRMVMDAAVSVIHRGVQHCVRASRRAPQDRVETTVGPITVEVVEPLRALRVRLGESEHGLRMDARFLARAPVIEEPRFVRRSGVRSIMDYTRLTQHGAWEGELEVTGERIALAAGRVWGSRDRSWGVRPLGEPEGGAPPPVSQFFWLWGPVNFPDLVAHFDVNEEADGSRWHEMGVVARAGEREALQVARRVDHELVLRPGTRRVQKATVALELGGERAELAYAPLYEFAMSGIGYLHPTWGHGMFHGELETAGESWRLADVDPAAPLFLHVQAICEVRLSGIAGGERRGMGVLEQLILGPHAPLGLTGLLGAV